MLNVTVSPSNNSHQYPCLKIFGYDGTIVLFTGENTGTCVKPGGGTKLGYHSYDFGESSFKPYFGSVTLSQTKEQGEHPQTTANKPRLT